MRLYLYRGVAELVVENFINYERLGKVGHKNNLSRKKELNLYITCMKGEF